MSQILDHWLSIADRALRTVHGLAHAERPYPAADAMTDADALAATARRDSAALMRVNHVGEVCAQALYEAQALGTRDPALRAAFRRAAAEELDHLAWTERRIAELGGRPSLLNPLWYAGAFAIGFLASRLGDEISLGFMAETERQVEQHLASHLDRLPADDAASRAIVQQMQADEAAHGAAARAMGGAELPPMVQGAMRAAARVMTTTAHYV